MTRVRSVGEGELIVRALGRLVDMGCAVVIADRDSPERFVEQVRGISGISVVRPEHDGLVGQVVASVGAARQLGRSHILYTEPDKEQFFQSSLEAFLGRAGHTGAAISLAARSAAALHTFPAFQTAAESEANRLCAEVIGITTDYFYGPFVMTQKAASLVGEAPLDSGWGWRPFVFAAASLDGRRLDTVEGDYWCPREQQQETDADKRYRLKQFAENMHGLLAAVRRSGRLTPDRAH